MALDQVRQQPNVFGKLLARLTAARQYSRETTTRDLWERNGLREKHKRIGYKLAVTDKLQLDGTEITEYRLYKLIDASVVTITSTVETEIKAGMEVLDGEEATNTDNQVVEE